MLSFEGIVPAQTVGNFSYDYWNINQETILHRKGNTFEVIPKNLKLIPGVNVKREENLSNIYDLRSNVLYTIVNSAFFKNDTLITSNLRSSATSSQGALILPDIWNGGKLYLFTQNGYYSDLVLSIYDIDHSIFTVFNMTLIENSSEQLHSIFIQNSFILTTTNRNGDLITIVLDSNGVKSPKYHLQVNSNKLSLGSLESIKFSNKGNLISALYNWQTPMSLYLYKYDILNDEACLISYNNTDLTPDSYNHDFNINDKCIYIGSRSNNTNIAVFDIAEDFRLIKRNEINEKGVREMVSIPNEYTVMMDQIRYKDSWYLKVYQYSDCGDVFKSDTLCVLDHSFCIPNIPKVMDSLYAPPDYPCIHPDDIEYTYRSYDENFVNIITPNNDGYNDDFSITWPEFWEFSEYKVTIINRYGQTLFTSRDVNFKWDGQRNGRQVPNGAYYYVIEFQEKILGQKVFTGVINVID